MGVSIFEVCGPVMIGPSSSHTAGAARLGRMARLLVGEGIAGVEFHLYGSFAKTYRGHGTDLALVAGVLGMDEADEELADSFRRADRAGLGYKFIPEEKKSDYENEVRMVFRLSDGETREISGCSLGGGRIRITGIDGFETKLGCESPAAVIMHWDRSGALSHITAAFAKYGLNIAIMRCTRNERGQVGCSVLECDSPIPPELGAELEASEDIISVSIIDPEEGEK